MALPIVRRPDVNELSYINFHLVHYRNGTRYVQKRPFNLVLPCTSVTGDTTWSQHYGDYWGSGFDASEMPLKFLNNDLVSSLKNKSFDKLKSKTYSAASVGLNLLEGRQSLEMIVQAASTLRDMANAVRKGDPRAIRRLFGPRGSSVKVNSKSFAGKWLQFHFGWSPLLGDIYDALETYISPVETYVPVRANASDGGTVFQRSDSGTWVGFDSYSWSTTVKTGLVVKAVKDPVAFTLEQYGLNNPAALAWETVPYSFVVDWVANVGDFLQSFTAFAGLDLISTYTTVFHRCRGSRQNVRKSGHAEFPTYNDFYSHGEGVYMQRESGLPAVTLELRSFKPPSKTRVITAVSLLLQQLR